MEIDKKKKIVMYFISNKQKYKISRYLYTLHILF